MTKTGLGQDSHAFVAPGNNKQLILGGVTLQNATGLKGNSDADVVLHALTNAISSITTIPILGKIADDLCQQGITDSAQYLAVAKKYLDNLEFQINHIAISIEAKQPHLSPHINPMRKNLAQLLNIDASNIGITATTGEGLTSFGQGLGIQALVIITVSKSDA